MNLLQKFLDYSVPTLHAYPSSMMSGGLWSLDASLLKANDREYTRASFKRGLAVAAFAAIPMTLLARGVDKISKTLYPPKKETFADLVTEVFDKAPIPTLIATVLATIYGYRKGKKFLKKQSEPVERPYFE